MWFLRGLADSDGSVYFKNRSVGIITSPNGKLVGNLLDSLKMHYYSGWSKGCMVVVISLKEAAQMQIFNPHVATHRRKALEKLVSAKTFQRRWPSWLEAKVQRLLKSGFEAAEISHRIYEEDDTFVRSHTIRRKAEVFHAKMRATAVI